MKKLYMVEFGKPTTSTFNWSNQDPTFVVADSYDEAARKATAYRELDPKSQSVLTSAGDLNMDDNCLTVKGVKLITEELIV